MQILLPIDGFVDLNALRSRLEKDFLKADKEIQALSARLANPNFANKAPALVVDECRSKLTEAKSQANLAQKRLSDLL